MGHACNSRTWEAEEGLQHELEADLDDIVSSGLA